VIPNRFSPGLLTRNNRPHNATDQTGFGYRLRSPTVKISLLPKTRSEPQEPWPEGNLLRLRFRQAIGDAVLPG